MKLKVGQEVVVSDHPESPLYCITEISKFSVRLGYTTSAGMRVDSGWHDITIIREPTQEQINNYRKP